VAILRLTVEQILANRCGPLLDRVGLVVDGEAESPALTDAIRTAILQTGGTAESYDAATDADLATVPAERVEEFLARAEYRCLLTIQRRFAQVRTTIEGITVDPAALARSIKDAIALAKADMESYGPADGTGAGITVFRASLGIDQRLPSH
jgi:hypothetical protein